MIFDPFYQSVVDDEDESVTKGTGLGLNIVKRITQLMGGRVEVDSSEGKGSTFRMVLPYFKGEAQSDDHEIIKVPYLSGSNIVFVDSALITMDYYKVLIGETGANHITCTSIDSARDYFDLNVHVDIVFIGLKANNTDVLTLINKIKSSCPGVPIVALVSPRDPSIMSQVISLGYTDFIEKPISRRYLYPILEKYLKRNI